MKVKLVFSILFTWLIPSQKSRGLMFPAWPAAVMQTWLDNTLSGALQRAYSNLKIFSRSVKFHLKCAYLISSFSSSICPFHFQKVNLLCSAESCVKTSWLKSASGGPISLGTDRFPLPSLDSSMNGSSGLLCWSVPFKEMDFQVSG